MELKTFLKIWIVAFTALVIWLVVDNRRLSSKAEKRANEAALLAKKVQETQEDIQRSRLESCIANYNNLLQAFAPFKPAADNPNTPRDEIEDYNSFTNNLKKKRSHCAEQVKPKERNEPNTG